MIITSVERRFPLQFYLEDFLFTSLPENHGVSLLCCYAPPPEVAAVQWFMPQVTPFCTLNGRSSGQLLLSLIVLTDKVRISGDLGEWPVNYPRQGNFAMLNETKVSTESKVNMLH